MNDNPAAQEYLHKRGVSPQIIKRFGIGYAPPKNALLNDFSNRYSSENLYLAGLVGKSDDKLGNNNNEKNSEETSTSAVSTSNTRYYDRFRDRIIFPIIDIRGRVIGFGGRAIGDGKPKYLNSPDTPVFDKSSNLFGLNLAKNSNEDYLLLVEGYMDVVALHQAGFDAAVASLGTAFTERQAVLIARRRKRAILCYDSDEAGQKALMRGFDVLRDAKVSAFAITVDGAKDPDEYIAKRGAAAFAKLIRDAKPELEYKIYKYKETIDISAINEKIGYIKQIAAELALVESPAELDIYCSRVADLTGVTIASVTAEVERQRQIKRHTKPALQANLPGSYTPSVFPAAVNSLSARETHIAANLRRAEQALLNFICYDKAMAEFTAARLTPTELSTPLHALLYQSIQAAYQNGETPDPRTLLTRLPEQANEIAALFATSAIEQTETGGKKAVADYIRLIKAANFKRTLTQTLISASSSEAEATAQTLTQLIKKEVKTLAN